MLSQSTVIKNRWKITSKIGQGAFGETYAGFDLHTYEEVAVKVERWDNKKMVLKMEVMALKKLQGCPQVVRYIHSGRQDEFNFLVMERLGDNLAELRKRTVTGAFSMATTLKLGMQMLDSIEGIHNLGYVHRDIKPSNFVVGRTPPKSNHTFLIDFGLARKFRLPSGEIRPPRKTAGFRGTARYASINSHQLKELSRRDDLWSLFYVLVEFALGQLPWRKVKDKDQIGELKEKYTNPDLVRDLPREFLQFMEHLQRIGYADSPDYDFLRSLLLAIYTREGYPEDFPFDWDIPDRTIAPRPDGGPSSNGMLIPPSPSARNDGDDTQPVQSAHSDRDMEMRGSVSDMSGMSRDRSATAMGLSGRMSASSLGGNSSFSQPQIRAVSMRAPASAGRSGSALDSPIRPFDLSPGGRFDSIPQNGISPQGVPIPGHSVPFGSGASASLPLFASHGPGAPSMDSSFSPVVPNNGSMPRQPAAARQADGNSFPPQSAGSGSKKPHNKSGDASAPKKNCMRCSIM